MQIVSTKTKPTLTKKKKPQLPGASDLVKPSTPTPKLKRPVLVVPGGNARSWGLPAVMHYLCHGEQNEYGGSIRSDKLEDFKSTYNQHGGDVFCIQFTRRFGSTEENAKELRDTIKSIREVTGSEEIDIVAECKGVTETRFHLQELGDGVRNLIQLVPPNRGMPVIGDLASAIAEVSVGLGLGIEKLGFFEVSEDNLDTFSALRSDVGIGPLQLNPTLSKLNSDAGRKQEAKALHSNTILMGKSNKLMGLPSRYLRGDGQVSTWSAYQEGAMHFGYEGPRSEHGRLATHPEALKKMREVLLTDGHPETDKNHIESVISPSLAAGGLALQTASLIGQGVALFAGFTGQTPGALGIGLMAASGLSAGLDLIHHVGALSETDLDKNLLNGLRITSDLWQLGGLSLALSGQGSAAAVVLGASQLLNAVTGG